MRITGITSIVLAAFLFAGPGLAEDLPLKVDLGPDGIIVGSVDMQEKLKSDMVSASSTFESDPMDFDRKLKGGARHVEAKARALRSARDKLQDVAMQFADFGLIANKHFWVGNESTSPVYTTPSPESKERPPIKGYKAAVSFRVFVAKDHTKIEEIIGLLTDLGVDSVLVPDPEKVKVVRATLELKAIRAARDDASVRAEASGCIRGAYLDGQSSSHGGSVGGMRDRGFVAKGLGSSGDSDAVVGIDREVVITASASSRYRCVSKVTN